MAVDRPLQRRRRTLAVKVESTTGTAEALTQSEADLIAYDSEITPEIEMMERPSSNFGKYAAIHGKRGGSGQTTTHAHGNGATGLPYWAETLLLAAGFSESTGTFTPDSTSATTLTMGLYEDGNLRRQAGCKTDFTWTMGSGQPTSLAWTWNGKIIEPTAASFIVPPSSANAYPQPPRFVTATMTLGGTAYKVSQATLAMNNTITMREDANADDDPVRTADGTGIHAYTITDMDPTITVDPESVANGTKNWQQDMYDHDTVAVSIVLGSDANNTITISSSCTIHNVVPTDRNGIQVETLTLKPVANASNNQEPNLSIAFS